MKNPKGEVKLLTHLNWRLFVKDEAKRYSNRTSCSGTSKLSTKKDIFLWRTLKMNEMNFQCVSPACRTLRWNYQSQRRPVEESRTLFNKLLRAFIRIGGRRFKEEGAKSRIFQLFSFLLEFLSSFDDYSSNWVNPIGTF